MWRCVVFIDAVDIEIVGIEIVGAEIREVEVMEGLFLYLDSFPVAFCVCCVCAKSATHCWVSFCWRVCSNLVVCRFVDHVLARRPLDLCRVLTVLCGLVHFCEWRNLRFFVREFLQVTVLRHGGSSVC